MSEDCNEEPVLLLKRLASYDFEDGDGHLYIIDKEEALRIGLVDLSSVTLHGCRPRTIAQEAWLLGPLLGNPVPKNVFVLRSQPRVQSYGTMHFPLALLA